MKANAFAACHNMPSFVSAQMYYTVASRDIEREIVPLAQDQRRAIMPCSHLAGGRLSGKFDFEHPGLPDARRSKFDFPPVDKERAKKVLKVMHDISDELDISVARVALAWILTRPFITSVIIGAKTQEQLNDNIKSSDVQFSPEQIARLDEVSALPPEYLGWMVQWQNRERRPQPEVKK